MVAVDDVIRARWYYKGRQRKARLVVIHATQSPERSGGARGVALDFANRPATNKASAHVTCDDRETIESVAIDDTAFAAPNANADGYHIEQVGYSEQSVEEWADDYSLKVVGRAATAAREACDELGIPKIWLSVDDVRAGKAGITDHNTVSLALGGSHWDPGPYYHRDLFMALVVGEPAPALPKEHDMASAGTWVRNDTELWVATRGTDSAVWARVFKRADGNWGDWFTIGGSVPEGGDVDVTGSDDGQVDVVVIGQDRHLWHKANLADGTWLDWEDLGGQAA